MLQSDIVTGDCTAHLEEEDRSLVFQYFADDRCN